MSVPAIHEIYEQRNLSRFRAFLSSGKSNYKGKERDRDNSYNYGNGDAIGPGSSSLSKSPRFHQQHHLDGSGASNQPSKEEVNARDRWGRTVLHLIASNGAADSDEGALEYLDPLLACTTLNVNLQDRENGWTALHRALYAGNLIGARRILQHPDTETNIRDLEGLTAFDLLNSTLLGTNPSDLLDNLSKEEQASPRRELVTWGANRNFVLGLQGDSDRTFPERVPLERVAASSHAQAQEGSSRSKEEAFEPLPVRKIAMEKLHSGLITDEKKGNFRICGFGSTTGRLGYQSQHPQFAFEPLRDFGQQTVVDFALGQDHTVLCTDKGDVWTFGSNTFSVLGYPVETSTTPSRSGVVDDGVQASPKRLVGILKKEFVIGVAASRYHTAVFTADSLFTWGKNNGQLGYPSNTTPLQPTPRRVSSLSSPIKQMCATEVATVCLLEGGEVFVLHRDTHFKILFPMSRFPPSMQVYRPPNVGPRPVITKIAGSGTTFIALSSMGDVFSWQLDNPSLESPSPTPSSGRDIKPVRIWEDRKTFTAVTDACIANDTIVIATRSGHVYVRSRKKELATVKGFELRGGNASSASSNNNKKSQYKFTRVSNLQRIVNVAVSSSGGFGAIRSDAHLLTIDLAGPSLSQCFLALLPHYRRAKAEAIKNDSLDENIPQTLDLATHGDAEDEEDDEFIEGDKITLNTICKSVSNWNPSWSLPAAGSDILLVAGSSGIKIPVHSVILSARSETLATALRGTPVEGITFSRSGTDTLLLPHCSHLSALLLVHYLYGDDVPAIYDPRLFHKIQASYPELKINPSQIKAELQALAKVLKLPALSQALQAYGKMIPEPTLARDMIKLSDKYETGDVILRSASRNFRCHSPILRARCPFFEAIFDDPDWYASRREEDDVLEIDLEHIDADIMAIVLRHIYTNEDHELFGGREFAKVDEKLDFVTLVLAAANELLLDRLKAACSAVIRPLINMHTVCAILSEAVFYEAASLRDCCMQYICCNIETMLEQHLLDILPSDPMRNLSRFCRKRQLDRMPRTARSVPILAELQKKHADWLQELDIARPTGSYKKALRQASAKSPKLSPAMISTSLRLSPCLSPSLPAILSPPRRSNQPGSLEESVSPEPSPLVQATTADDIMFDMDDLSLDDQPSKSRPGTPSVMMQAGHPQPFAPTSSFKASAPWQRATSNTPPTTSLRDIMSADASATSPIPRRTSESRMPPASPAIDGYPLSPPSKLSQKDRKRQQQQQSLLAQQSPTVTPAASVPWRPSAPPAAWKPPVATRDPSTPSLASIQSAQAEGSRVPATPSPMMRRTDSARASATPPMSSPLSALKAPQPPQAPVDPASAVGARVITPTRLPQKRQVSSANGPPETRASDRPWVSYTSTVSVQPMLEDDSNQSFASIQNLQATEREALRVKRGAMSLAEIQAEENKQREEAAFLSWFEEESKRTQAELGMGSSEQTQPAGRGGRGGNRGGKRGGGAGQGQRGRGGARGRGRGKGPSSELARVDD